MHPEPDEAKQTEVRAGEAVVTITDVLTSFNDETARRIVHAAQILRGIDRPPAPSEPVLRGRTVTTVLQR